MIDSYGDPLSALFWKAAAQHRLLVQLCAACQHRQFYPRPFCLECLSDQLDWVEVSGAGNVYSMTRVHVQVIPALEPPYTVALIDLDVGIRLLGNLTGRGTIGSRVRLAWREREDAPPVPVFETDEDK